MQVALLIVPLLLCAEPAEGRRVLRSHDISFLTRPVPQLPAPRWPSAGKFLLEPSQEEEISGGGLGFSADSAAEEEQVTGMALTPDAIVGLIRTNIAEDSWANERNSIEAKGEALAVVQVPAVQDAIAGLLVTLRARRAVMFSIDIALVPAGALGGPIPEPRMPGARFEEILSRAGEEAARISLTAYNEQTVSASSGRRRTSVVDTEVNQTGVIPVQNAVVRSIPLGITVEVEPRAVTGSDLLRLRLQVVRLSTAGEIKVTETFFADVESIPLREESLGTVLYIAPGEGALAGVLEGDPADPERGSFAILARARRTDVAAAPPAVPEEGPDAFGLRLHDVALLLRDEGGEEWLPGEIFLDLVRSAVDPEAWKDERAGLSIDDGRFLKAIAKPAAQRALAAWIDGLRKERTRLAVVEVTAYEGTTEAVLGLRRAAPELPGGWEGTEEGKALRRTLRTVLVGVPGTRMKARAVRTRRFLEDIETTSGGTGFSVVESPDPVFQRAGDGFAVKTCARSVLDPGRLHLDLAVDQARTAFEDPIAALCAVILGPPAPEPGRPPDANPRDSRADLGSWPRVWVPYAIDLPRQDTVSSISSSMLPAGRPSILRIAEGTAGKSTIIIASIRLAGGQEGR